MLNKFLLGGLLFTSSLAVLSSANAMEDPETWMDKNIHVVGKFASSEAADKYELSVTKSENYLSIKAQDLIACCNTFDPQQSYENESDRTGKITTGRTIPFPGKEGIFDTKIGSFSFSFYPSDRESIGRYDTKAISDISAFNVTTDEKNDEFQYSFTYQRGYGATLGRRPVLVKNFSYVLTLKQL